MDHGIFHIKGDKATTIGGIFSLVTGNMLIFLFFLMWSIVDIYLVHMKLENEMAWKLLPCIAFITAKLCFFFLGTSAVFTQKPSLLTFVMHMYIIYVAAFTLGFLAKCIVWVIELTRTQEPRWTPATLEKCTMIHEAFFTFLLVAQSYESTCLMQSLINVFTVGGTGWEKKNYKDIKRYRTNPAILSVY
jgi:hypothetical protein